eukprot:gene10323-12035_t
MILIVTGVEIQLKATPKKKTASNGTMNVGLNGLDLGSIPQIIKLKKNATNSNDIDSSKSLKNAIIQSIFEGAKKKKSKDYDMDLEETLTPEQERLVHLVVNNQKNVFFTGSAGTGKSFVLKHLVTRLREKHSDGVYVTAATGIAAVNIGGVTLHSFAGIKLAKKSAHELASDIMKAKKYFRRWLEAKVLIIDEISMIDAELFEKIDEMAQIVRGNTLPFGGVQLVLCGDFFQLPPVYGKYAFEGEGWKRCVDVCFELTTVMRQKEEHFVNILNKLRRGYVPQESIDLLQSCSRPLDVSNGVLPTKLYTTNADVDSENNLALEALPSEPVVFTSMDSGDKELIENLERDCPAPNKLTLKVGAQVVLLRKMEGNQKLVNGSRGVVVEFAKVKAKKKMTQWYQTNETLPVVLFNDGSKVTIKPSEWNIWSEKKAARQQLPLKLAWALTIHRAQGMTLDKVECRLSQTFANGQGYVALSRAKTLDGLCLHDFNKSSVRASPKVKEFVRDNLRNSNK